jgi:hypothetical protein
MNEVKRHYFDPRHGLSDPELNAPEAFVRAADFDALSKEIDARCDRAYCDGADTALVIAGDSNEAASKWKAGGYGGRRAASRAALTTTK